MRKCLLVFCALLVPFALYFQSTKIVRGGKPDFSGNWENFHEISTHRAAEYGPLRSYSEEQVQTILSGIFQKKLREKYPSQQIVRHHPLQTALGVMTTSLMISQAV